MRRAPLRSSSSRRISPASTARHQRRCRLQGHQESPHWCLPAGRPRSRGRTHSLDDDTVRIAVIQRLPWIKSRRKQLQAAERQSQREMVSGETHHIWGIGHRLIVVEGAGKRQIEVRSDRRLTLSVPAGTDAPIRRRVLEDWYRAQLRERIPTLIEQWEPRIGRSVEHWQIKRMKTKWGSCTPTLLGSGSTSSWRRSTPSAWSTSSCTRWRTSSSARIASASQSSWMGS